ncbi:MAG: hypothetical protein Q7V01_07075 [Vicinamibacterales bacterium]|nr:hypothetical protein [Vicinamibacterales bacterium]
MQPSIPSASCAAETPDRERGHGVATNAWLALLSALLLATAAISLHWRVNADAAIMLFMAAAQQDAGLVIYRDLFDMNAPGAHLAYRAIVWLVGWHDLSLRLLDLSYLTALMCVTAFAMRPFGRRVAWAAAVLTSLVYLGSGQTMSLQREFLLLVPTAVLLAVVLKPGSTPGHPRLSVPAASLAGLCVGVASTIKPQAGLLLLVVLAALPTGRGASRGTLRLIGAAMAGAGVWWGLVASWLWVSGAWSSFVDMAVHYWPLYDAVTARPYRAVSGLPRLAYLADGYVRSLSGPRGLWLAAAACGIAVARIRGLPPGTVSAPLVVLAVVCACFPGVTGKFWGYHWLPFGYATMLLASLACVRGARPLRWRYAGAAVLLLASLALPFRAWKPDARREAELRRVDRLSSWLAHRAQPGDLVQPLDWSGTALHAMLLRGAPIATALAEDVHLYHHADNPFVQRLRTSFVRDLRRTRPRFILDVAASGWAPSPDSQRPFRELAVVLSSDYQAVFEEDGVTVYERTAPRR